MHSSKWFATLGIYMYTLLAAVSPIPQYEAEYPIGIDEEGIGGGFFHFNPTFAHDDPDDFIVHPDYYYYSSEEVDGKQKPGKPGKVPDPYTPDGSEKGEQGSGEAEEAKDVIPPIGGVTHSVYSRRIRRSVSRRSRRSLALAATDIKFSY